MSSVSSPLQLYNKSAYLILIIIGNFYVTLFPDVHKPTVFKKKKKKTFSDIKEINSDLK